MEDVDSGEADYAISDAREFSFAHHLYPNVLVGFALPAGAARAVDRAARRPELLAASTHSFTR